MSIPVPLKGFGGGGANLNFKVVGNPKPTSPKENTIWIDTDEKITNWIFSATEPENPSEGMVWISTGTSSTVEFNALKKNGIQVYPLSAKQYVSGAWVDVTAMSYQGGEWVAWIIYAYNGESTGWIDCATNLESSWGKGTMSIDSGAIILECTASAKASGAATEETYNLSGRNTIKFDIDSRSTGLSNGKAFVAVASSNTFYWNPGSSTQPLPECVIASKQFSSAGTVLLDISSIAEDCYIVILASGTKKVYCSRVTIES